MILRIGTTRVEVESVKNLMLDGEACDGLYDPFTKKISLDESLDEDERERVLFQEIGHAVYDIFGFGYSFKPFINDHMANDFEEVLMHSYSRHVYDTLVTNGMYKKPK